MGRRRILGRHAYDDGGRGITSELADGREKVSLSYGTMNTVVTDALGNETTYEWNRFHGVRYVTKRTGPCASCGGSGDVETWEYDHDTGRLMKHTDADGIPTTYTYYADGAMATEARNGFTTTYTYEDGKVSSASGTDGSLTSYDRTPDPVTGYEILTLTEKVSATEGRTTGGAPRARHQVESITDSRAPVDLPQAPSVVVVVAREQRRVQREGSPDCPRDRRCTTSWRHSWCSSRPEPANEFVFAYDDVSRRTTMTYPNGVVTSYTYDELDRLLRIRAVNAQQQAITDFQYEYDDAGNRTRKSALAHAEDYGYDDVDRLVEVTRSGLPGHWLYAYDRVGNRVTEQIGDAVSSWTYNEKNQLLSRTGGGPLRFRGTVTEPSQVWVAGKPATLLPGNAFEATVPVTVGTNVIPVAAQDPSGNVKTRHYQVNVPSVSATYTYDANGNLATKIEDGHSWTYEWTAENQLARVFKDAVEQARLSYDPLGRRVEKVAGTATSAWTYDAEE